MRALLLVVLCACPAHTTPRNTKVAEAGISIALYAAGDTRYGVVDDRRWVEVSARGHSILLDNIDPGAALASLVIESANPALRVGRCSRDRLPDLVRDPLQEFGEEQERLAADRLRRRIHRTLPEINRVVEPEHRPARTHGPRFAPIVRCEVAGPAGRHLVRVVYVASTLSYRAHHDIALRDGARATIESRFAIATPSWRERAEVVLFEGTPGGERAPREIARGQVTLDGGTSVLVVPPREVSARIRRIYAGPIIRDEPDDDDEGAGSMWMWGDGSMLDAVWATLELPGVRLPAGAIRVHVELPGEQARWIDLPMAGRPPRDDDAPLRLPLWIDDTLRGTRQRNIVENDGARMVEAFAISISNTGDTPREVWIEESVRAAKRRRVERPWPTKPTASGDLLRSVVEVRPGRVERVGYLVVYEL